MEIRVVLLTLILLFAGCNTHPIPDTFLPLEELVERPWSGSYVTTIHTAMWVENIEHYLETKPEGSPLYVGNMIHERIHSLRMGNWFGTISFVFQYVLSTEFMWEEESICWYYELMYLNSQNIIKPYAYTAAFLTTGYANITGSMISPVDALRWVHDVFNGKWKPDISEEEEDLYYNSILEKLK